MIALLGNPIWGLTIGGNLWADFVQTRHTMPLPARATFLMEPRQQAAFMGGIFGPNGENAGALLEASNANTVEFRGDFVARRSP